MSAAARKEREMNLKTKPVLGEAPARMIIDRAVGAARTEQLAMAIAVVDDGGFPLCLQRMDGAGAVTAQVALDKARTAALMRAPSRRLADRVATEPALLRLTEYLPLAGGLPILFEDQCIGGIGVSGGTPDQDEAVCGVGLEALRV
jgi:glc operon protein GlcG